MAWKSIVPMEAVALSADTALFSGDMFMSASLASAACCSVMRRPTAWLSGEGTSKSNPLDRMRFCVETLG